MRRDLGVPRISAFYGIVIRMYHDDHEPPHFHAQYAEHSAKVSIETGEVMRGRLPRRALRLIREWAGLHREELAENWRRARRDDVLKAIEPLP